VSTVWTFVLSAAGYVVIDKLCSLADHTGWPWLMDLTERLPCPPPYGKHAHRCRSRCGNGHWC
jgi:hypothetical protein